MKFTLYYKGPLKSNGTAKVKHSLRRHFHPQLKTLWNQKPLSDSPELITNARMPCREFNFVPLICEDCFLTANIEIDLIRPIPPGYIVSQGGDIDNQLKTLLDALRVPSGPNDLPKDTKPEKDEDPFYCLLEDDKLITNISVITKQFLDPEAKKSDVILILDIKVGFTQLTINNSIFF